MGTMLEQTRCLNPECGSSDALTLYEQEDGSINATCFSCGEYFDSTALGYDSNDESTEDLTVHLSGQKGLNSPQEKHLPYISSVEEALQHPIREIKSRNISYQAAEKYGVRIGVDVKDGISPVYSLVPRYKDGMLTGFSQKIPSPAGNAYRSIGDCKQCDLFGLHAIPQKGKKLFITEGWEDCLSLYQVLKENSSVSWEPAVVALLGAGTKKNSLLQNMDVVDGYDEVVLVLDQDHVGREASIAIAKMLAGKASIVTLPLKDPNAMLMSGKGEELKWAALTGARKYQPDGIVNAKDIYERYKETGKVTYYPFPDFLATLNDFMYGAKEGSVITIGAGTAIGKTSFMRELKHHFLKTTDKKIADIELESDVTETLKSIVGLELKKRITLPNVEVEIEEEEKAYENLFSSGRYTLYDYFGGMDDDSLFSKLRYFAATGHTFIFLDHLSIIVSEYASHGGERERIDTIMTRLAKLAKETGVCIFLVVHLKKSENSAISFEQGAIPDLDDLRGSSSIKQLSWDVIFLSRNTQHEDPLCAKTTEVTSAKCRLTGRTGSAGFFTFNDKTGKYYAIDEPCNYRLRKEKKRLSRV